MFCQFSGPFCNFIPMRKMVEILGNSFRLAMLELKNNKLRTTLSLLGVTFGIFCIIGVLATVNSLEQNVQNDINELGSNTIYIDKWDYSGGPDYPWWKYVNRPTPKFDEMKELKARSAVIKNIAFTLNNQANLEHGDEMLERVGIYGITQGFVEIQPFEMMAGRYFSMMELEQGTSNAVIGYENAEKLFGKPEKAIGQEVKLKNKKAKVIGVIKKQGKSMIGGWEFDQCLLLTYPYYRLVFEEKWSNPNIMVQGQDKMSVEAMRDELKGTMRNLRRLGPRQEDDFSLNSVSDFSKAVSGFFGSVSMGGWFIGLLSLIVGAFSIANIMFVTVRERTPIIGLKKAIGAKRSTIMAEFLLESAFICLLGGAIGILLVYILTFFLTKAFEFPVFISMNILGLAGGICIAIGILAGIIPASIAAKMDPVVAIRSK
jgi:putative ABC transport system permease protein